MATYKPKGSKIVLKSEKDVVHISQGSGKNIIYNYDAKKDILYFDRYISSFSVSGKDLILYSGNAKVTLKNLGRYNIGISENHPKVVLKNQAVFDIRCSIQGGSTQERFFFDTTGLSYKKNDKKTLVASSKFKGYVDLSIYDSVKTFDGRTAKKYMYIDGAADMSEVIYAGNYGSLVRPDEGNDTVYCGKGKDTIEYQSCGGNDTYVNFNVKQDLLELTSECGNIKNVEVDGKDLVVTIAQNLKKNAGNGTVRFKNGAAMSGIRIKGRRSAQTRTIKQALSYSAGSKKLKALTTNVGGKYNLGSFAANAITLDASKLKTKATLIGNAKGNKIIAGQSGSEIRAGKGNDAITCGNGKDRIWFAKGEGKDTVLKSGKNDVAYLYGIKDITQVTAKLSNGVMQLGIKGASDTLNIDSWQAGKSLATVELGSHKKYTVGANGKFKAV